MNFTVRGILPIGFKTLAAVFHMRPLTRRLIELSALTSLDAAVDDPGCAKPAGASEGISTQTAALLTNHQHDQFIRPADASATPSSAFLAL